MTEPAASRFASLQAELLRDYFAEYPTHATWLGVHDHDHRLADYSPEALARRVATLRAYQERLAAIPAGELSPDDQVDWEILSVLLADLLQELTLEQPQATRPDTYVDDALSGCYLLVAREFAPAPARARSLLGRLEAVPRVLAEARANLGDPSPLAVQVALEIARGGEGFFTGMVPAFAREVPELEAPLIRAARSAAAALAEFAGYLEQELLPRARGDFALGRERFDWKLKHLYRLPYDSAELRERGEELIRQTLAQLEALARQIDPLSTWQEIIAREKQRHPAAGELLSTYQRTVAAARQFILDRGLVDLPPGEQLQVAETPPFMRPTLAYAAYLAPGPFERLQEGIFLVTPVDPAAPAAEQAERLEGHNYPSIKLTALHEAYPGHHLQLTWANQHPSRVRRLVLNTLFAEGWTLYCEQLMDEEGWLESPVEKLFRLKDQLWRACRVALDAGLHTQGMPVDEAIRTLVEVAHLEPAAARTEVTGYYCLQPTVPMSYLIGKEELLRLKADYQAQAGSQFSLRQFHQDILRHGSIPWAYIRRLLGLPE